MDEQIEKAEQQIEKLMVVISKGDAFSDPVLLSQLMVRLAYANHTIGRGLASLQATYRIKRREVYQAQMDEHGKVTRAKEASQNAAFEEESRYDHFFNLHSDTQTFINVCQSHLKMLAMEAKSQI